MEYNNCLLLYTANLIFIVTNLSGWVLKRFYIPKAYASDFTTLFPAQRLVASLYLVQIFELPYLLNISNADALFYVNAFSILIFSSLMFLMVESYFFLRNFTKWQFVIYFLPVLLMLAPLLLQAVGLISLPTGSKIWAFYAVTALFVIYFYMNVRITIKINRAIRRLNVMEYSSAEDFPISLAKRLQWLPISICLIMYICFAADNVWVKFTRDIIFILVNVWFVMLTIDPWRTVFSTEERQILEDNTENNSLSHMSNERYQMLQERIKQLMDEEKIFLNPHLTMEQLMKDMQIATNRRYVSETIGRLGYKSFYDMINRYRVEYAIVYIRSNSDEQLKRIASECGFSTQNAMSKMFRSYKKNTPTSFRNS